MAQSPYPQNTAGNHPLKQAQEGRRPLVTTGDAGDETSAILDAILLEARNADGVIIIISRLGYGETKHSLHDRLLHNALTRLVCYWAQEDKLLALYDEDTVCSLCKGKSKCIEDCAPAMVANVPEGYDAVLVEFKPKKVKPFKHDAI